MKTSIFSQSLYTLPIMEGIEATAEIGFHAIEIACAGPHLNIKTAVENPDEIAEHIQQMGL